MATVAINLPHCLLTFGIGRALADLDHAAWVRRGKQALVPVTVGLILASGVVMGRAADHGPLTMAIAAGTAVFLVFSTRNPLWALGVGMLVSLAHAHLGPGS
jgi:chromate transporter